MTAPLAYVLDDDPAVRAAVLHALGRIGYNAREFSSPAPMLQKLDASAPPGISRKHRALELATGKPTDTCARNLSGIATSMPVLRRTVSTCWLSRDWKPEDLTIHLSVPIERLAK